MKKENNKLAFKKLDSQLDLLVYGQEINREELRVGFRQLTDQNRFLSLQNQQLLNLNQELKQQLATVVEELNQIKQERQGIAAAKKAGKYRGRKTVIDDKLISEVKHLKQQKMLSVTQIVKITGRSRNTIYKVLKEHLGYVSNRLVQQEKIDEPK